MPFSMFLLEGDKISEIEMDISAIERTQQATETEP